MTEVGLLKTAAVLYAQEAFTGRAHPRAHQKRILQIFVACGRLDSG